MTQQTASRPVRLGFCNPAAFAITIRAHIRRHPITWFIALAFTVSYLLGIPFLAAVQAWLPQLPGIPRLYLSRLFVVLGPAVAAFIVCAATEGRSGVIAWVGGLRPKTRHAGWWAGLPVLGGVVAFTALMVAGASASSLLSSVREHALALCAHFMLQFAVVGIGEEMGWRGWLLPALLRGRSRAVATAIVAVVWGAWHGPMLLSGLMAALTFLAGVAGLAFLFTRLWSRVEGNLFVLALAHASVNAPFFFLEQAAPAGLTGEMLQTGWSIACLLYAAGAALLIAAKPGWWRGSPYVSAPVL